MKRKELLYFRKKLNRRTPMSGVHRFSVFLRDLRLAEASFLAGIPVFGYLVFAEEPWTFQLLIVYLSALFCALSVFSLGEHFASGGKFLRSLGFLLISSLILSGKDNLHVRMFPGVIFLNWVLYYLSRRFLLVGDILLHFAGGVLQFYFGVVFSGYQRLFSADTLLIALAVSSAFTAGYMVDLVQDIEEDRLLMQKNIADVLGKRSTFIISSALFIVSYLLMWFMMNGDLFRTALVLVSLVHLAFFLMMLTEGEFRLVTYRTLYRVTVPVGCVLVLLSRRPYLL